MQDLNHYKTVDLQSCAGCDKGYSPNNKTISIFKNDSYREITFCPDCYEFIKDSEMIKIADL